MDFLYDILKVIIIVPILTIPVIFLLAYLDNKKVQSDLKMESHEMYFGKVYKAISLFFSVAFLCIMGLIIINVSEDNGFRISFLLTFVFFLVALYNLIESYFTQITFNESELTVTSFWRKTRVIPLKNLIAYQYSHELHTHIFITECCGKLRLSTSLKGITNFFILLEKHKELLNQRLCIQMMFEIEEV